MFDAWERMWPEKEPVREPLFVVAHEKQDP